MIDLYQTIKDHPQHFRQLSCRELLFTQYDCPQVERNQDLFSGLNFFAYVLSGKRIIYQPGYSYQATAGKCFFSKKGGWIAEKEPANGWCVLVFFMPDSYLKQFINEYRSQLPLKNQESAPALQMMELDVSETTRSFFHSMIPYFLQQPPPPESLLELKFRELVFTLLVNPLNHSLLSHFCTISDRTRQPLQETMEANYVYNLSLEEFARLTQRSLASFKREFKSLYNTSPGKWLIQKRLDYACMLIHNSAKNINEIAFESGFENTTHFSRVFKAKFGHSPLHLRKMKKSLPEL
jgi:AraC-like DNA-binding protein